MAKPVDLILNVEADTSGADLSDVVDELESAKRAADDFDQSLEDIDGADIKVEVNRQALATAEQRVDDLRDDLSEAIALDLDTKDIKRNLRDAEGDVKAMRKTVDAEAAKMEADLDIEASIDIDADTQGGLRRASETTAEFKDEARQNFGEITSSFTGEMDSIADLAQGTLGGLAGTLTGPLGLALGVAAAGVGLLYGQFQKAAEEADELLETATGLARELADADEPAEALAGHWAEVLDSVTDAANWFERLTGIQDESVTGAAALAAAYDDGSAAAEAMYDAMASSDPEQALERLRGGYSQLQTEVDAAYQTMLTAHSDDYQAAEDRWTALKNLEGAYTEQITVLEQTTTQADALAEAERRTATAAERAETAQEELTAELDASTEAFDDASGALDDYVEGLGNLRGGYDDFLDASDALTQAVKDNGKRFGDNSKAARDNRDALDGVSEAAWSNLEAMIETGASVQDVTAEHQKMHGKLVQTLQDMGLNREEARELADQYLGLPKDVETKVKARDEASSKVAGVEAALDKLDGDEAVVVVDADTTEAERDANAFYYEWNGKELVFRTNWALPNTPVPGSNSVLRNPASPSSSRSAERSVNLVRVNIAGREVQAIVDEQVGWSRESYETRELLGAGRRF